MNKVNIDLAFTNTNPTKAVLLALDQVWHWDLYDTSTSTQKMSILKNIPLRILDKHVKTLKLFAS